MMMSPPLVLFESAAPPSHQFNIVPSEGAVSIRGKLSG